MNQPSALAADPAQRGAVTHIGDAGDDGREHQRRDDHLDQLEEDIGQQLEIICPLRQRRITRRIGDIERPAHQDAKHHAPR